MTTMIENHPYDRGYWYCDRLFKDGRTFAQIRERLEKLRGKQFREGFQARLDEFLDPVFDRTCVEKL
jgi:hypothetical protein